MTIEDTVNVVLTNTWAEVKDRSSASLTGKKFRWGAGSSSQYQLEYAVADTIGNVALIGTEVSTTFPMLMADAVGTGKKLFVRGKILSTVALNIGS